MTNPLKPIFSASETCCICYSDDFNTMKCFWGCSLYICKKCVKFIIKISKSGYISFKCPQCRKVTLNIKSYQYKPTTQQIANTRFTYLCEREIMITRKILSLYSEYVFKKESIDQDYIEEILLTQNNTI